MDRNLADTAATVLLVLGVAALLVPALFPVQQVLYHETRPGTMANGSELEEQGYTVVEYENLSERGQQIYVAALRSPGEYTVPAGAGAAEFPYEGAEEFGAVDSSAEFEQRRRATSVIIERPANADLPPADEPVERIEDERRRAEGASGSGAERATPNQTRLAQREQQISRYDLLVVRQGTPPLTEASSLLRLGSVLLGTVAVGVGGYLRSRA